MSNAAPTDRPTGEAQARGIDAPLSEWIALNIRDDGAGGAGIAPFPPPELMRRTSGLTSARGFASHGIAILSALAAASPRPLSDYRSIFDFGVGCGRLARMFKGFRGHYVGVDIDIDLIAWVRAALPWIDAHLITPKARFPFPASLFEAAISISVFTHMDEADYRFYMGELARVLQPGGIALITLHSERVLKRAEDDETIRTMLAIGAADVAATRHAFDHGKGFHFVSHGSHPALRRYRYGTTFSNEAYARKACGDAFEVVSITPGAIHDFQDLMVLRRTDAPFRRNWLSRR